MMSRRLPHEGGRRRPDSKQIPRLLHGMSSCRAESTRRVTREGRLCDDTKAAEAGSGQGGTGVSRLARAAPGTRDGTGGGRPPGGPRPRGSRWLPLERRSPSIASFGPRVSRAARPARPRAAHVLVRSRISTTSKAGLGEHPLVDPRRPRQEESDGAPAIPRLSGGRSRRSVGLRPAPPGRRRRAIPGRPGRGRGDVDASMQTIPSNEASR